MRLEIDGFDHEVKRVHVLETKNGTPVLVCVHCCDKVARDVGVVALPDGQYLHVGEQADVNEAAR